jgi:hypothetical protein
MDAGFSAQIAVALAPLVSKLPASERRTRATISCATRPMKSAKQKTTTSSKSIVRKASGESGKTRRKLKSKAAAKKALPPAAPTAEKPGRVQPERAEAPAKPPKFDLPPILFEGDAPAAPLPGGRGQRYALAPLPPLAGKALIAASAQLPESYGTKRLVLTARDPHWLHSYWDLTREQRWHYNSLSAGGHLTLRVFKDRPEGAPFTEVHVQPESRSWFIQVGLGGTRFCAELGYYDKQNNWNTISKSASTMTPPDTVSDDVSVWFETLPSGVKFEELVELVKAAVSDHVPLMEAILQLREVGLPGLPDAPSLSARQWTPEQEKALAQLVSMDSVRRVWVGSLEITELIRRQFQLGISSAEAPEFSRPVAAPGVGVSGGVSSISSPYGVPGERKGFWFNVNAELIVYGATEPDATVVIAGRKIKLRPDGSFSYRFSLPDGTYALPAHATSADASESRSAELTFSRTTEYRGEVSAHPQDSGLKPPQPDNVS